MTVSVKPLIAAGFDLKGLKKWNSRDGGGYQFTLTHRGVPVCEVTNDGHGGMVNLRWVSLNWQDLPISSPNMTPAQVAKEAATSKVAKDALTAIVASTPPIPSEYGGGPLAVDAGWLMEEMVNLADLRKICKAKTAFRKAGADASQLFTINAPCDDKMRAYIAQKYPGATILNDEVSA